MSRDRGIRLQNALAAYLRQWWPSAESAGSGRPGTDVAGTPGVVWENKTATGKRAIGAWIDQARSHVKITDGAPDVEVVVYWPPGVGEDRPGKAIAMMPLATMVRLLREAGYAPPGKDVIT